METVQYVLLETTPVVIQVPDFGVVAVAVEQTHRAVGAAALDIMIGHSTVHLPHFARWGIRRGHRGTFTAHLFFEFVNKVDPLLFLFGVYRVVCLSPDGSVTEAMKLNRSEKDDKGFYRDFRTLEFGEGFLLLYEAGVAKITYTGRCLWHTELSWNDWFERIENDRLVFTNEFVDDGREWYIDAVDGTVHQHGT